jgi:hypothetical protein
LRPPHTTFVQITEHADLLAPNSVYVFNQNMASAHHLEELATALQASRSTATGACLGTAALEAGALGPVTQLATATHTEEQKAATAMEARVPLSR